MLKAAPQILPVESHCELEAFLGYLGKTQVGFKCSGGWQILSAFTFCIFSKFLTTSVSTVARLRSTKNLLVCWPA